MANKEIIEKFKSVGFKEYEAKVITVLMKGVPMSVPEIANDAKLLRNSIYDILKSFAVKGYCNTIETGSTLKYQIINPDIIIDKVEREFAEQSRKNVSTLKDAFTELKDMYKDVSSNEDSIDNVELIRGFNKHRVMKYMELIHNARYEILSMNHLRGVFTEEINDFTKDFVKRGGVIKALYKISLDFKVRKEGKSIQANNDDLVHVCEMFESYGEQVKLTAIEIPNMVIIDREKVYLNLTGNKNDERNKQTDLIVNDKRYAENMRDLFEGYWERSATIKEYQNSHKEYIKQK